MQIHRALSCCLSQLSLKILEARGLLHYAIHESCSHAHIKSFSLLYLLDKNYCSSVKGRDRASSGDISTLRALKGTFDLVIHFFKKSVSQGSECVGEKVSV